MKRPVPYALAAVFAFLLLAFLYLFSLPVVYWAVHPARHPDSIWVIQQFYRPSLELAERLPPYRALLRQESDLLGVTYQIWPPLD